MFCCTSFWLLRCFRFCLSTPTRWGWYEALPYNLSSPLIQFFFLTSENELLNFNCCQARNTKQQYLQIFTWLRWLCSESLGWRFNLPYSREAGWSLNIHMWVLLWREDWGHRTAKHSIFGNNSTQQDKWNFMQWHPLPPKKRQQLFLILGLLQDRKECEDEKGVFITATQMQGGIWQRMVKKPSSQQNTIKRFISLERAILGWDMISAGFGLSQTISGMEDSVIVSTT